jgi:ABC-type nitrate/sulfonate/bicarbonate transport system substrate-binding protein
VVGPAGGNSVGSSRLGANERDREMTLLSTSRVFGTERRRSGREKGGLVLATGLAALLAVTALPLLTSTPAAAQDAYVPADPEPGTDIPKATVRTGFRPYADGSFPIIGVKKGFFSDVGIEISPPEGLAVTEDTTNALLIRGDIDIVDGYPPNSLPTYQTSQAIKQVMFHDVIVAGCILASPDQNLKTIKDYIAEGQPFAKAIASAMAPLEGQKLAGTPVPNERLFEETIGKLSGVTWQPLILDDPKLLVAAKAGQVKFAHPSGAPIVYTLIKDGWKQLVCLDDLIAHGPTDADSPIRRQIAEVGVVANGDWVNKNPNTLLRYLSAEWRTIDAILADPSLYDIQAPVLNKMAGTNLTGEDVANTVKLFQPYVPFDDNAKFYTDEANLLYYKPLYEQIIKAFVDNGVIPAGLTPDQFVWGGKIWQQLVDYRNQTDKLLAGLDESKLDDAKKSLVAEARKHYGWHNYLDAYRFAKAASE